MIHKVSRSDIDFRVSPYWKNREFSFILSKRAVLTGAFCDRRPGSKDCPESTSRSRFVRCQGKVCQTEYSCFVFLLDVAGAGYKTAKTWGEFVSENLLWIISIPIKIICSMLTVSDIVISISTIF